MPPFIVERVELLLQTVLRAAGAYDRRSSVTSRSGAKAYFFRSLRISFIA
jgi:hypothetical protein